MHAEQNIKVFARHSFYLALTECTLMQGIFTDYKQPFAVTYLGASLMVVYLPIAFIKDCICDFLRKRAARSSKSAVISNESPSPLNSPLKYIGVQNIFEIEIQGTLTKKDSELDLPAQEEGKPLVPKHREEADTLKQSKELTTREVATYGFYIAPIWFITEVI